jgi:hypothetical protein
MIPLPYIDIPQGIRKWSPGRSRTAESMARAAVRYGRRIGFLGDHLKCVMCRVIPARTEFHHEDYSAPFRVSPLCQPCHKKRHAELGWGVRGGWPSKEAADKYRPRILALAARHDS